MITARPSVTRKDEPDRPMAGTTEIPTKSEFPQLHNIDPGVQSLWSPKCGSDLNPLIEGKFRHNVEAHESASDSWPSR